MKMIHSMFAISGMVRMRGYLPTRHKPHGVNAVANAGGDVAKMHNGPPGEASDIESKRAIKACGTLFIWKVAMPEECSIGLVSRLGQVSTRNLAHAD